MRILAIDPGQRRWGLAVADDDVALPSPLPALDARSRKAAIEAVVALVERDKIGTIVLGLPLELSSREGTAARAARALGSDLASAARVPVVLWDERLSTVAAHRALRAAGLDARRRRAKVDSVAAALVLEAFLTAPEDVRARAFLETTGGSR